LNNIKESILKFVPARYIYLFGSYAYGNPTEESDIDIYVVTPDDIDNFSEIYAKIIGDLREKEIYFIDLLFGRESVFNTRKVKNIFEKTFCRWGKLYMEIEDVAEWMQIADDDLYSAKILNGVKRKFYEIIWLPLCSIDREILKGLLDLSRYYTGKTHNLLFLHKLCMEKDNDFQNIVTLCDFLNRFANDIRYPHKYEVNDNDANFSINAVEKIRNIKPLVNIRNKIHNEDNKKNIS
jgi:predicted nucleotidyltransferase